MFLLSESCSSSSSSPSAYFLETCSTLAFSSTSFLHISANYSIFNLASSFFCFMEDLLDPVDKSEAMRYSAGQHSRTTVITSFVTKHGRSYHFCAGSFCALMETQWKFALSSTYSDNCSKTVGERNGLQLIAVWMLDFIRIQNSLLSLTLWGSFVA